MTAGERSMVPGGRKVAEGRRSPEGDINISEGVAKGRQCYGVLVSTSGIVLHLYTARAEGPLGTHWRDLRSAHL